MKDFFTFVIKKMLGNMPQLKEQEQSPEKKELNEMEASNLLDIEFKRMIIKVVKELSENYKELSENYRELSQNYHNLKKDIETIKKNKSEMKDTLEGINSRVDEAEDLINLEDKVEKNLEQQKEKRT